MDVSATWRSKTIRGKSAPEGGSGGGRDRGYETRRPQRDVGRAGRALFPATPSASIPQTGITTRADGVELRVFLITNDGSRLAVERSSAERITACDRLQFTREDELLGSFQMTNGKRIVAQAH